KNQVATFRFVGINLRPGANRLRLTAIAADGSAGRPQELNVMGRGPAKRLEIVSEQSEIQAGGNDFTIIRVKTFDEWNNPALDGEIAVETSIGQLLRPNDQANKPKPVIDPKQLGQSLESANQPRPQQIVQTAGGEALLKLVSSGAPGEARLHATTGNGEAEGSVRFTAEQRSTIMVGLAEMSFGKGIPEVGL